MDYREAIRQFVDDPSKRYAEATRSGYRWTLTQVDRPDVRDITEADLVALCTRPMAGTTQAKTIKILRSFFAWAEWKGLIDHDPARNLHRVVRVNKQPVRRNHWLDADEVRRLLASLPNGTLAERRNRVLFQLGFSTGLRRAELAGLRWDLVDLDRQEATLTGKGGKRASVFLTDRTVEVLRGWRAEAPAGAVFVLPSVSSQWGEGGRVDVAVWSRPLSLSTVSRIVADVTGKLGNRIATHDMRRSFAGIMVDVAGIEAASTALRHSNLGVTQVYLEKRQDAAFQIGKEVGLGI